MTGRFIFFFLFLICTLSCAPPIRTDRELTSEFNPLLSAIHFYREKLNHLSAVKAAECPMYPSCSSYSMQSFEKHGFFVGWAMTCDRLMRCGRDELRLSPEVTIDGQWKCYDPVERNDFWWHEEKN
jgi:uncharacterized protein